MASLELTRQDNPVHGTHHLTETPPYPNLWAEMANASLTALKVDLVAFGDHRPGGEIHVHHWTFSPDFGNGGPASPGEVLSEVKAVIAETIEQGILHTRTLLMPEPVFTLFLPIEIEGQRIGAMLIGRRGPEPFSDHQLAVCRAWVDLLASIAQTAQGWTQAAREWQTTFDATNDAIWVLDQEQRIVRCNAAAERLFGRSAEEIVGEHCWTIVHGTEEPVPECPLKRAKHNMRRETMEIARGDRWLRVRVDPIVAPNGEYNGAVHIITDITAFKQTHAELAQQREMLANLHRAGQQIGRTLDTEIIFQQLHDILSGWMPCDSLFVSSFSPDDRLIRCIFAIAEGRRIDAGQLPPIPLEPEGQGVQSEVIRTGQPLLVSDFQACVRRSATVYYIDKNGVPHDREEIPTSEQVTRSALLVPMILAGQVVGVIQVLSFQLDAYTKTDLQFLESIAGQVAVAFHNARLYQLAQDEIAERERAQEALVASERRFRELFQNIPACCFTVDREGIIHNWNRACEELYGWTAQEAIGKSIFELMVQEQNVEWARQINAAVFAGQAINGLEFEDLRADGSRCTVLMNKYPLRDASDQVVLGVCAQLDITDRVKMEMERERLVAQIREQAHYLEQILATVPTGVLLLDADGHLLSANPIAEKSLAVLADVEVGDIITHLGGRPLAEFLALPPTHRLWHEVHAGKRTFEIIARPVQADSTEPERWVLVINDVTQEREVQLQLQQQERMAVVGQLAAGIAHDFNNILASIMLYAQIVARSESVPPKERERLGVIVQQTRHASGLIQQILDFSRRAMLERRPLDLLPLIKEQVRLLKRTLPEHITVEWTYGPDEYAVNADPTRMQQILTNLAVNARDAMPEGGVLRIALERITVEPGRSPLLPEMEPGDWIVLRVTDTGTGIPADALPHIFEPFFTTKGPGEGSGLGLAQVYGIVGQHGGRINVDTEVGKGTTFHIYLPALEQSAPRSSQPETATIPQGQGELVLLVEDEATVRAALAAGLEQLNYRVLTVANGKEALAVMEKQGKNVALVLTDMVMPTMGGLALFHALRERGWKTPVILLTGHLLTGHPMTKELDALHDQGLVACLTKPPDLGQLAQVLADALRGHPR